MSPSRQDIFKYSVATLFLVAFAFLFWPFYGELLLAAVFAFAMEPFLGRFLNQRHLRWKFSVALVLLLTFLAIAVPICYVVYRTYRYFLKVSQSGIQNSELFQKLAVIKEKLIGIAESASSSLNLDLQFELSAGLDEALTKTFEFVVKFSTGLASEIPGLLVSTFVFCAALFYFLSEARSIKGAFMKQRLLNPQEINRFIAVIQNSCSGTVITTLIIAILQATIVTAGSLIFDVGDAAVVWVVTFFFAFIPILGAGPVALSLGLYQLLMAEYGAAIGFLIVAVVAGTADNLARAYLISSNEQDLHPVVSLLAIVGALLLFGMPGLFLGPVIAGVAVKIIPTLFEAPAEAPAARPK